jgi:hypothetical protein
MVTGQWNNFFLNLDKWIKDIYIEVIWIRNGYFLHVICPYKLDILGTVNIDNFSIFRGLMQAI